MRLYRASFVAGFAAGFVAGARSGKETYDQIVKYAQAALDHPAVQQARGTVQTQAQKVGGQLADRMPQMAQSAAHSVGARIPGMRSRDEDTAQESTETSQFATTSTGGPSRPGDDLPT
jgi:flagellar biosynthesis component FlhA